MRNVIGMVILSALAPAATAHADVRVIVSTLSGPAAGAARSEIVRTIEDGEGWDVVGEDELERASARLGRDPGSPEVAADVGASAILEGRVVRRGRRFVLALEVRDASSGRSLATEQFAGRGAPGLRGDIRRALWDRIGFAMRQGRAPTRLDTAPGTLSPRRTEHVDAEEMAVSRPAPAAVASAPRPSPLWIALGATMFSRDFGYTDDVFFALRPYRLPIGLAGRAQARWYPGAHVTSDLLAHVGLEASFGAAVGLRTRQSDDTTYATDSLDAHGGLDVRIPLAPVELGIGLGYGVHTYSLAPAANGAEAALPDVEYQFVRPALRAEVQLGAGLSLDASFGWRVLTGTGELAAWFPRSSGSGFDAAAHVAWESELGVGARLGFEMQRYFFSMSPEPGDARIAGGAEDQLLAGTVDITWRLR